MKRIIILTIALSFSLTAIAYSAELYSPYYPYLGIGDTLVCTILNAGSKEITGKIEICGIKGCIETCDLSIFGEFGGATGLTTERWKSCAATYDGSSGAAFCKIIFNGNPRDVRAQACLVDDLTGEVTACAPIQ